MIELLVIVGLIATLAAILIPVLAEGKEAARKTACFSNLKQWGLGFSLYIADSDDTFPNQEWADIGTRDENGNSSWIQVIQPYAERATNINALGADMDDQNGLVGKTRLNVCPSQRVDVRAGMFADGSFRPYKSGVKQSYGMSEWSVGAWRPYSLFAHPATTVLLGENYLNYNQTLFYPADSDEFNADGGFARGRAETVTDCRFDRPVDCRNAAGFFPAHPQAMPGVHVPFASNLGNRHFGRNNFCFVDGHAKSLWNASTFRADGSFSMWTISNRWIPR